MDSVFFEGFADELVKIARGRLVASESGAEPSGIFRQERQYKISPWK